MPLNKSARTKAPIKASTTSNNNTTHRNSVIQSTNPDTNAKTFQSGVEHGGNTTPTGPAAAAAPAATTTTTTGGNANNINLASSGVNKIGGGVGSGGGGGGGEKQQQLQQQQRQLSSNKIVNKTSILVPKTLKHQDNILVNKLVKETNFNRNELRIIIDQYRYVRNLNKNTFDKNAFRDFCFNYLHMTDDLIIDRIFKVIDYRFDLELSESEFINGLNILLRGNRDQQIEFCHKVYDLSGIKQIRRDEIIVLIKDCMMNCQEEDVNTGDAVKDLVEISLRLLDVDRDGVVSLEDFKKACNNNSLLMECLGLCIVGQKEKAAYEKILQTDFDTNLNENEY